MADQPDLFPKDDPWWKKGIEDGEVGRDVAVGQLAVTAPDWVARCRHAMITLYAYRAKNPQVYGPVPFVNGDDATGWFDRNGYQGDNRIVGAVFKSGWVYVRRVKSRLAKRHARPLSCWRPDVD